MGNDVIRYEVEVYPTGTQAWWLNGKLHREEGPAIVCANGVQHWYLNGELHREEGPAVITPSGEQRWYLYGDKITEKEHKRRTNPTKELTVAEIEALLGHKVKIVKG